MRVERKTTGKLALARLGNMPKEFWKQVADTVEAGILDNIVKQKQADGSMIKTNARSTLMHKIALRRGTRSLVDEKHRFVKGRGRSWKAIRYLANGAGVVVGPATQELRELSRYVQQKGYTGWMGISATTRAALKELWRLAMVRLVKMQTRSGA